MGYTITKTQRIQGDSRSMQTVQTAATLDEARGLASAMIGPCLPDAAAHDRSAAIPEAGGTIGPLPDSTVIEVRHG